MFTVKLIQIYFIQLKLITNFRYTFDYFILIYIQKKRIYAVNSSYFVKTNHYGLEKVCSSMIKFNIKTFKTPIQRLNKLLNRLINVSVVPHLLTKHGLSKINIKN